MPVVRIFEIEGVRYGAVENGDGTLTRNCGIMLTGLAKLCGAKRPHVFDVCEMIKKETGEEWKWKPRRSPVFVEANFSYKVIMHFHSVVKTNKATMTVRSMRTFDFLTYADFVRSLITDHLDQHLDQ